VIAHDPHVSPAIAQELGVELTTFERLLETSDYISVHAPLTAETRGLFNAAAFGRMKQGAYIVNTARDPLIDEGRWSACSMPDIWAAQRSTSSPVSH